MIGYRHEVTHVRSHVQKPVCSAGRTLDFSRAPQADVRVFQKGQQVTEPLHRPKAHQAHAQWTPSKLITWAESVGPGTGTFVKNLLETKRHPEQGHRACLGLRRLTRYSTSDSRQRP